MKKIKNMLMIMVLMFSVLVQPGQSTVVQAAGELKPDVTITDFKVVNEQTEYEAWGTVDLALTWDASAYNNTLVEGDYFDVVLPDNMVFPKNSAATHFPLKDTEGHVVANAVVKPLDDGGGTVRATFTNYVKDKYNIKGTMNLAAQFQQGKINAGEENSFTIIVGNTSKTINLKFKGVVGPTSQLDKWGEDVPGNDNAVRWSIRINFSKKELVGVVINDELLSGETIVENSFKLYSMYWNKNNVWKAAKDIGQPLNCTVNADKKSFTCDLSNIVPYIAVPNADNTDLDHWEKSTRPAGDLTGASIVLMYNSTYQPGTTAKNKVVGTSVTWGGPKEVVYDFKSASSGGTGEGNKGKVKIIKVDAIDPNIKLPQAKFEIRIKDTDQLIETMITGDNGEAISRTTLDPTKKYILKEVSTPPGYEVSSTSQNLEFVPDLNKLTDVAVENKRILTKVSGEKTWEGDQGYNVRPASIEVQLLADGNEVPGKKLTVTPDPTGNWTYEFKDLPKFRTDKRDDNGNDIPIVYTVKEVVVPEGYISEVSGMNVKNKFTPKEYEFKFKKTDVAGTELSGATIVLRSTEGKAIINDGSGTKVKEVTWVSDGTAKEVKLEAGTYEFVETAAPEGYAFATKIEFTLNSDGTVDGTNVTVEGNASIIAMVDDYKYHPITVSKVDLGGTELPGAKIVVKSKDGSNLIKDDDGNVVNQINWESTDTAKVLNLRAGEYVFHEESAPDGFTTVTDIEFKVGHDGKVEVTLVAEDDIVKSEGGKIAITDRKVPEVKTEAKVNDKKEDAPTDKVVLTDVVKYSNLIVGKTYVAKLVWMDKATNQPFLVDGQEVRAEKEFVATTENGEVELSVTIDAKHFVKDVELVAFEEVYKDGIEVAAHKDINDEDQTVKVKQPKPDLKTLAHVNGEKEAPAKDQLILTDTVKYKNVVSGKEYTVKLVWMDKATNQPFLIEGNPITAEKTFTAQSNEGEVELSVTVEAKHFTVDTNLVAFEKLIENGVEVGAHEDINDVDQMVTIKENFNPVTISKVDLGGTELPGAKITIKSADGSELIKDDNGQKVNSITFESTDVAKELQVLPGKYVFHEESAPQGYLTVTDIEFEVDKDGKVTVTKVAEDDIVKSEGGKIAITDRKVPEVKTEAKVNDKKEDAPTDKVVLTDVVKYSNLIVGKTYVAKLVWMDKATNQPFLVNGQEVRAEKTFTALKENGEVELSVTVDAKHFVKDVELVAFEEVYKDGIEVAAHKDINDENQTIKVKQPKPELKTLAHANGKKEATLDKTVTLTDRVDYKNLVVGKEYTVKLVWMNKATGEEVKVNGQVLSSEKTFVAKSSDGQVELSIEVLAKHLKSGKLVAFETLYENGVEVGAHKDINDVDQTVLLTIPELPQTGYENNTMLTVSAGVLILAGLVIVLKAYRKKD